MNGWKSGHPEGVLKDIVLATDKRSVISIDNEIEKLEKAIIYFEQRRRNLLDAMALGEFNKDEILDRLNKIKRLQPDDETKLNDLQKTRAHIRLK